MNSNTAEVDMNNVIDIVKKSLMESGHDGLYNDDADCACLLNDLQPCGEDFSRCRPGYKHSGSAGYEYDWSVKNHKETDRDKTDN